MEIYAVPECLDDNHNPRFEDRPGHGLKAKKEQSDSTAVKLSQERALEFEKHPKHLGDREDHLAVRNIKEERLRKKPYSRDRKYVFDSFYGPSSESAHRH